MQYNFININYVKIKDKRKRKDYLCSNVLVEIRFQNVGNIKRSLGYLALSKSYLFSIHGITAA